MVNSVDVLRVGFVLLANAAAGATGARHPRQAQGPARKVPAKYGNFLLISRGGITYPQS
jgi:hypothetical protein